MPRPGGTAPHPPTGVGTNTRSGSTFISFHINGPGKSVFLLDTGAQRSCVGECTFVGMGGDLKRLKKSKNSFIFGDGPSTPSLGVAKKIFLAMSLTLILSHVIFLA